MKNQSEATEDEGFCLPSVVDCRAHTPFFSAAGIGALPWTAGAMESRMSAMR